MDTIAIELALDSAADRMEACARYKDRAAEQARSGHPSDRVAFAEAFRCWLGAKETFMQLSSRHGAAVTCRAGAIDEGVHATSCF